MTFNDIQGQERVIATLRRMIAGRRIPSALLFAGPHSIGKRSTALALAKALNCPEREGEACGRCPTCRKIQQGVHPDVLVVEPEGQFIRIDQVREVVGSLALNPFEAKKRVVVVAEAERMNPQAAHAFLKTLEEPPADTLIVLCATGAAQLLETIVSRCLPIRFAPLPEEAVARMLAETSGLEGEVLEFALRFSQGRLRPELRDKAGDWIVIREELMEALERFDPAALPDLSEKFARWSGSEDWRFVLEWLESIFRDLAVLNSDVREPEPINRDRRAVLARLAERFTPRQADGCYRRVLETWEGILLNVNKALALDALWLDFREIMSPGKGERP